MCNVYQHLYDRSGPAESCANWYAVHILHQHEAIVEKSLQAKQLEYFLPKRHLIRRWSDRKKIITEPLFRGYAFVSLVYDQMPLILKSQGIIGLLGAGKNGPTPIPNHDIEALQRFIKEKISIDPFPYLREGMRVRIRKGPFRGIEGFIAKKKSECRIVLSVELMQQSVSVSVDEELLEICK